MSRLLAFGLSGGVGQALLPTLLAEGHEVVAVSRRQPLPAASAGLQWQAGALPDLPTPPGEFDVVLSLGPLDRFVDWFAAGDLRPLRLIALGSMSLTSKRESSDAAERAQAAALAGAETRLFAEGRARSSDITVLRPTLVYGSGQEPSLAPLVRFARRWRVCPFPAGASGLRQPVHVDDIASAVAACLAEPRTAGRAYDLPGGETLRLDDLVRRTLQARAPGSRLLPVPASLLAMAAKLALRRRSMPVSLSGFLSRRDRDQCADITPAQRDFGYTPGLFRP